MGIAHVGVSLAVWVAAIGAITCPPNYVDRVVGCWPPPEDTQLASSEFSGLFRSKTLQPVKDSYVQDGESAWRKPKNDGNLKRFQVNHDTVARSTMT